MRRYASVWEYRRDKYCADCKIQGPQAIVNRLHEARRHPCLSSIHRSHRVGFYSDDVLEIELSAYGSMNDCAAVDGHDMCFQVMELFRGGQVGLIEEYYVCTCDLPADT